MANKSLDDFLWDSGLAPPGEHGAWTALAGGVSSDIWEVKIGGRRLCVKRALSKLKVSADWFAPTKRNTYEWAWLKFASRHLPVNVPTPLAHDAVNGILAMSYLPIENHPVWKAQLLDGDVDVHFAGEVGRLVGRLHSISASEPGLINQLGDTASFDGIRLDPYLTTVGIRHPALAPAMRELIERTRSLRIAAVHGDISPKNILAGPDGPVFLDAEAAWYGDPAFDLAFCLNHLLLKCIARPVTRTEYLQSFSALSTAYLRQADWEPAAELEHRAATLLPALLLARVDGKSPVEYITDPDRQAIVREAAIDLIKRGPTKLADVVQRWDTAISPSVA